MVINEEAQTLVIFAGQQDYSTSKSISVHDVLAYDIVAGTMTSVVANLTAFGPEKCNFQRAVYEPESKEVFLLVKYRKTHHQ